MTCAYKSWLLRSVLLLLPWLGGCESIEVFTGLRTRLDHVDVTALSAELTPGPGLAPGKSAALVVSATAADGKRYVTAGAGKGTVLIDSFVFEPTLVQINSRGMVSLPADPRLSDGRTAHLAITPLGHPEITAQMAIPVRYDANFEALNAAADGSSGADGIAGTDGISGMNGAVDPAFPAAGSPGGNGGRGQDGDNGGAGGDGPAVHIWLTVKPGATPLLLEARVSGRGADRLFLIDPNGGTLAVSANGGAGGRPGQGGHGGRGGAGGSGSPPGMNGFDGGPGADGRPGQGGRAGTLTVSVDESAQPYVGCLRLTNRSGDGLPGPAPTVHVEPVGALW